MPKMVNHELLSRLRQWAMPLDTPFPKRYRAILDHAFTQHATILSPSQLRDIGRGGTQQTAQIAIDEWLRHLHSTLGLRLAVGAEVPPELVARFERIVPDLWALSRSLANADFETWKLDLEQRLSATQAELDRRNGLLRESEGKLQEVSLAAVVAREDLARVTGQYQTVKEQFQQLEAAHQRLQEQLHQVTVSAEKELAQSHQRLAEVRQEMSQRTAEAENSRRREVSVLQEQARSMMESLQKEKREALAARDRAVAATAEADIAAAKAQRDLSLQAEQNETLQTRLTQALGQAEHWQQRAAEMGEQLAQQRTRVAIERAEQSGRLGALQEQLQDHLGRLTPSGLPASESAALMSVLQSALTALRVAAPVAADGQAALRGES